MLVKELIARLQKENQDDEVLANWTTRADVEEQFNDNEYEDENGNLLKGKDYVTNAVAKEIFSRLWSDHTYELMSEDYSDTCSDVFTDLLKDKEEAKEDTELWDTEQ